MFAELSMLMFNLLNDGNLLKRLAREQRDLKESVITSRRVINYGIGPKLGTLDSVRVNTTQRSFVGSEIDRKISKEVFSAWTTRVVVRRQE